MTRTQFLHVLTVALAVLGGIMAYGDKLQGVGLVPAELAQYWPVVLAGSSALRGVILFLGDWWDDGQINRSFRLLVAGGLGVGLMFTCTSCASVDLAFRRRVQAVEVNGVAEYDPVTRATRGTASARFELRDPSKNL